MRLQRAEDLCIVYDFWKRAYLLSCRELGDKIDAIIMYIP